MKKFISIILNLVLIILVLLLTMLIITQNTILSEKYILKQIESHGYYKSVEDSIKDSFRNNMLQSGIDENFVEELVVAIKVKEDINGVIHSMYSNTNYVVETDSIVEKLNKKIDETLEAQGRVILTDDDKKSIQRFVNAISDTYVTEITFVSNSHDMLQKVINKVNEYIGMVMAALIIATCLVIIVMFIINKNVKFLAVTLFANALLLLAGWSFVNYNIDIKSILMFTESFSNLLTSTIIKYMNLYLYVCIVFFVIALLLSFVNSKMKKENV